ncbi:hypothetical protein B5C34_00680 [Pacificimonas flava]|uniref:DUF1570 domain-containing protein n=2 Tax=Pacificimonas TaxID=1960290 RepID=A0A219B196_9SPHN|nr:MULTISPECIES: hypothetical protein [Pacificimonas]MBZ6378273.1 hypothetical protein [Pacificimonas aurantium]OWV32111.1 hypothetical protein B5C34_00680 [Pacificimonas flava]
MIRKTAILAALCAFAAASPATAEWVRAETDNFRVYSRGNDEILAERAAELERFDGLLRRFTGVPLDKQTPKLDVWLLNGVSELRRVSDMNDAAGFYRARPNGVCAFALRSRRDYGAQILFHEYAHHFMMQHFPVAYPKWFVEGFAEYFMTAEFDGPEIEVGRYSKSRAWVLGTTGWMALEDVLRGNLTRKTTGVFYGQSWLLTHNIYSDIDRARAFPRYLESVAAGEDPVTAWELVFGESVEEADKRLREYFATRRVKYRRMTFDDEVLLTDIPTTEYPNSSDDMLPRFAMLDCSSGDPEEHLRVIRDKADDYDDRFATATHAYAEAIAGDTDVAIPALQTLTQAEPDNPDHYYYLGRAYSRRAHEDGQDVAEYHRLARIEYARAYKLRPDHVPTLYYYAHDGEPYRGENERNMLAVARQLRPQVRSVNTTLAISLALAEDWDNAERVLAPVAFDPHLSEDSWARKLMQRVEARDVAAVEAFLETGPAEHGAEEGSDEEEPGARAVMKTR